MNDFAAVKYAGHPSKAELVARIAAGIVVKNSDACIAADMGLGRVSRSMHDEFLFLVPTGEHAQKWVNKAHGTTAAPKQRHKKRRRKLWDGL